MPVTEVTCCQDLAYIQIVINPTTSRITAPATNLSPRRCFFKVSVSLRIESRKHGKGKANDDHLGPALEGLRIGLLCHRNVVVVVWIPGQKKKNVAQ